MTREFIYWVTHSCEALAHGEYARRRQKVVLFLHDLAVFAVIDVEFAEPVLQVMENLESSRLHSLEHVLEPNLEAMTTIGPGGVLAHHAEPFATI